MWSACTTSSTPTTSTPPHRHLVPGRWQSRHHSLFVGSATPDSSNLFKKTNGKVMPGCPGGTLPLLIPSCVKKLNLDICSLLIHSEPCSCLGNGSVEECFSYAMRQGLDSHFSWTACQDQGCSCLKSLPCKWHGHNQLAPAGLVNLSALPHPANKVSTEVTFQPYTLKPTVQIPQISHTHIGKYGP